MKIPSRDLLLAGGLRCMSREVEQGVWLEHIVKHPLGAAYSSQGLQWNLEGWDTLDPAVVNDAEHKQIFASIGSLSTETQRCRVLSPEQGKSTEAAHLPCYSCKPNLVLRCGQILNGGIGVRYAKIIEALLVAFEQPSAVAVKRADFTSALLRDWCNPAVYEGLHVLSLGLDSGTGQFPLVRINRWDGVRAEFYFDHPDQLRWRTTFRTNTVTTGPQRISFLAALPRRTEGSMSDLCLVTRRWWESHEN